MKLTNGEITVDIDVARGAQIACVARIDDDVNALAWGEWSSPPPADAHHRYYDSERDWLAGYRGGWQETVPNVGAPCVVDGAPLPFHGEGSLQPWAVVDSGPDFCVLRTDLRLTLQVTRRMRLVPGAPTMSIETTVVNTGVCDVPMVWGHHPAFAADDDTQIHLPSTTFSVEPTQADGLTRLEGRWPDSANEQGVVDLGLWGAEGVTRLVYCHGHSEGWAVVRQGSSLPHVAMAWDVEAYPAIWVWQNRAAPGFPWFSRLRCFAIEPQRAWPFDGLVGAVSRGQALTISAGGSASSWITMSLPSDLPPTVSGVSREGRIRG